MKSKEVKEDINKFEDEVRGLVHDIEDLIHKDKDITALHMQEACVHYLHHHLDTLKIMVATGKESKIHKVLLDKLNHDLTNLAYIASEINTTTQH